MAKAKKKANNDALSPSMTWGVFAAIFVVLIGLITFMWSGRDDVPVCDADNITLTPGQEEGAAGTIYQTMKLKNSGSDKCKITGYPTVFLYGSNGYAMGNGAAPRSAPVPKSVTLQPGQTANTTVGFPQAGNFDPGVCSDTSTKLKMYIPGATTPLEANVSKPWCPGFSVTSTEYGS